VSDLISGGVIDWMFDKSLQKLSGDPDLDLAVDEFAAPGANIVNTVRKFVEAAFETAPAETFTGPASTTLGRIAGAVRIARDVVPNNDLPLTPLQKSGIVAEAFLAGVASGYNDFVQARAASSAHRWIASSGDPSGVEAKWGEVVAKGLMGMQAEARIDSYTVTNDAKQHYNQLKLTAQQYYDRVTTLLNVYHTGSMSDEQLQIKLAYEKAMLSGLEENEIATVQDEFNKLVARDRGQLKGLDYIIADAVTHGTPVDKALKYQIQKTPAITNEQDRAALLRMLDQWMQEQPDANKIRMDLLNSELEKAKVNAK